MRKNVNLNLISLLLVLSGLIFGVLFIPIIKNNNIRERSDLKIFTSSSASDFNYEWNRTWGGVYDDELCPYMESAMAIDSSNNIYTVGRLDTTGTGDYNIILIKCNSEGVEQWVRIWDGGASEEGNSILIDNSNEIYVVGITSSYADPDGDMLIIKYDGNGNQLWNFTWGGTELDSARVIVKDSSNNYYVAGETRSFGEVDGDAILVKFDSNWIEQWNVTWGGTDRDYANAMEIDSLGYIYIVGGSYSSDPTSGEADVMILKYDPSGSLIWDRDWGTSWTQRGPAIAIDSTNNIYFVGHTFGNPASSMKGHLVKYDSAGNYQWERIWGVDGVYGNSWRSVIIDSTDEIYICGATTTHGPYTGTGDVILFNYDTSGTQNWYKTWGMSGGETALSLNFDSQKNLYLAGFTESIGAGGKDIILMKYNHSQNQLPYLSLITPENKTYTQSDSGYYPATYGFESDQIGTNIDFIDLEESTGSCTLKLIPSFNNHEKVLDLYDTSSSYSAGGKNIFESGQDTGTVEFWWALTDVTRTSYVWLEDSAANDILVIRYSGSGFGRFDNGGWQAISDAPAPSNNQWYHIRIDWELTAGGYMGLSQNNFSIYIDGIQYGPYTVAITNTPDRVYLQTGVGASGGFHFYVDAIGYSWDPNYSIGDNLNEGLLLSYDKSTTLDWQGYSLDGAANKTIRGNTTILMPTDGGHNIQVFGNDTMGTMYESDMRYFTVNTVPPYITINSPTDSQVIGSTAPSYDITILGPYESIWYALEGGTNYTESGLTGTIDQSAWSALSDGIITIDFYANNSAGMEGTAQVQVFKDSSEEHPPTPPGIPGYDLYLFIGAFSVISALLIRKRAKS